MKIKNIVAREVISTRGFPGIETTVTINGGACGTAIVNAGISVGEHETFFIHDGGKRYRGMGVRGAVDIVNDTIAPAIRGMDPSDQEVVDRRMLEMDGTPNKSRLGGNSIASVSAANLKAAAAGLGIPLYRHIGGEDASVMPVPGVITFLGGDRYGGGERSGDKPSYSLLAYGFDSFADASYACWEARTEFAEIVKDRLGLKVPLNAYNLPLIPPGYVDDDRELWDMMVDAVENTGNEKKMGFQVDVAAGTYYDKKRDVFSGLFSREDRTREDLIELYREAVRDYPFIVIEDPLDEEDYKGHATLTGELGIQVVGDDLFTTNIERVKKGVDTGACNAVLLKVNQIGTITESLEMVEFAYENGYAVMPCSSRGEGEDIADYAVGLKTGQMREGGFDAVTNRLLSIEEELGKDAVFRGRDAFKFG
jgi:enolase